MGTTGTPARHGVRSVSGGGRWLGTRWPSRRRRSNLAGGAAAGAGAGPSVGGVRHGEPRRRPLGHRRSRRRLGQLSQAGGGQLLHFLLHCFGDHRPALRGGEVPPLQVHVDDAIAALQQPLQIWRCWNRMWMRDEGGEVSGAHLYGTHVHFEPEPNPCAFEPNHLHTRRQLPRSMFDHFS